MSALPAIRAAIFDDHALVALDEAPDVVAEAAVPLRPAEAGEVADLVQPAGVPGLGDDLGVGQLVVELDVPEDRRIVHRVAVRAARQDRGEVEAEAVDVHLADPEEQALGDELLDQRDVAVERVPAARQVRVELLVVGLEVVVDGVVEAAEADRRALVVALAGVVEDDVEDDLDAGLVEGLDHVPELADVGALVGRDAVALVRVEEADRAVAPVVDEPLPGQRVRPADLGLVELEDRQQLDRRDAQLLEVGDLVDDARGRSRGTARPRSATW